MDETMDRQSQRQWLRDLLEQMLESSEVLEWSENWQTEGYLVEKLLADLKVCQGLCENLRRQPELQLTS